MTTPQTKNIDGYMCSFEMHPDNGTPQVYIEYREFSGSLEFLMGEGFLMGPKDDEQIVPPQVQNAIEEWARSLGYFD